MKKTITTLCICAVSLFAGCVDREFDIAEASSEVTIGGEELIIPLGEIDQIKLGDMFGDDGDISSDEDGVFQIHFSSFGDDPTKYERISIDGISIPAITDLSPTLNPLKFSFQQIPAQLNLSGIEHTFDVDFPTISSIVEVAPVRLTQELPLSLPSVIAGQGSLSEIVASQLPNLTCSYADEIPFRASVEILEELKRIEWVEFGCDIHPYGTPFTIKVDLNGLQGINGGGKLKLNVEFPSGYYLRNADGSDFPAATHNILSREIDIQAQQKSLEVLVYLYRIDYSSHEFTSGILDIDDHIKYSYELELGLCAGSYNLSSMPKFSIEAAPKYKDVEVVINHFEIPAVEHTLSYSFNGLPSAIDVEKIAFTEDTRLTMSLKGLEWCEVMDQLTNEEFSPLMQLTLPKCMHFRSHSKLDASTNMLTATAKEFAEGISLSLEYIDCKAEGVSNNKELGQLTINDKIVANVDLKSLDNHTVLVSSLLPPDNFEVSVNISETVLSIDTANTVVRWSDDTVFDFNLEDQIPSLSQTVEIPDMISSIERIGIGKAGSNGEPLSMRFEIGTIEGATFPVNELDVDVTVNLGKLLHPTQAMLDEGVIKQNENGDYIITIRETWRPNEAKLTKVLQFDALENIPEVIDGKITLNQSFPVTGSVKIKSGESIDLSSSSDAKVNVDFKVDDIEVRSFTGGVNISMKSEDMKVDLGDLGDLGVNVNALSLNPILKINLKDNPTGIPFFADVAVKCLDSAGRQIGEIIIPTINIAGTGATNIVLSTPRNAAEYDKEGVTFVAVEDLSQILANGIPSQIAVNMSVATNAKETYTIDLLQAAKGYTIEYQYEVIVPFQFDGDLDISYQGEIKGLNDTFSMVADYSAAVVVKDIGLVAEFGTTIPFNIIVSAELIDAEGKSNDIGVSLDIKDCVIEGDDVIDGEKRISKVELDFKLGDEGSLAGLERADGVRFKFALYNNPNHDVSALSKEQYLDCKLKLRVRDGLTVDFKELLKEIK